MTTSAVQKIHGLEATWHILGLDALYKKYQTRLEAHDYLMDNGLPFGAIKSLSVTVDIDLRKEGEKVFGLGAKTIMRRKQKRRLPTTEAAMVFRIAEVVVMARDAFDDIEKAVRWLHKPCRALDKKIPLYLMSNDIGRGLVEDVLGQIKYGLYS